MCLRLRMRQPVQSPQDHSLAQRPRAQLERVHVERVHRRRRDDGTGQRLVRASSADPVQFGEIGRLHARDERGDLGETVAIQQSTRARAGRTRCRAGEARQRAERLARRDHPVRRPDRRAACAPVRRVLRRRARATRRPRPCRAGRRGSARASAAPRRAAATARPRDPRRRLPPAPTSRRRCRGRSGCRRSSPSQRRTARKVSRASSSPLTHLQVDAGLLGDAPEHLVAVVRVAHRGGREREQRRRSSSCRRLACARRSRHATSASAPLLSRLPCLSMCSARRSSLLSECCGVGSAPRCASTTSR